MSIYPRTTGGSPRTDVQHTVMARRILDRVRKGEEVRDDLVEWALTQTGDVRPLKPEEAAHCICPIKEAHAGMDEMGDYLDAHKVGGVA